ncbi:MAG: response regulator transcription factor [SAR202 cluster bacterium]|jgi:two-component system NarL family response regulator|nr:response regulator transcription factor [SAR202 cluster bacterium]MDP6715632.1 response regulator transcription factor [SAR202 cluster bacterium]
MDTIRVVVADDHDLFRRGLTEVLEEEDDTDVVGQAADGREASEQAGTHQPDVVMMDLNMPGQGGIEATAYIGQKWPDVKVLVLTVSEEPNDLFRALGVGALGYVLKTASPSEIVDALRQVYQGWVVVSPAMAPRFMADLSQPAPKDAVATEIDTQLTAREQDVLKLVARGMSNAEIAGDLIVSENTVKTHVKNVLGKLQMKNRAEAAAYASRLGFIG